VSSVDTRDNGYPSPATEASNLLRSAIGHRSDWMPRRPEFKPMRVGVHWIGPIILVASLAVSWKPYQGADGVRPLAGFAQYVGTVSIMLMAWSFVLAIRAKPLEVIFGGLDRMYRVHRWCGSLSVAFMILHVSNSSRLRSGAPGASLANANFARDMATVGEVMLYALVGVSLLRLIPYRYWRWTHKLLGIPFLFASWHFYTATKPFDNSSGWGRWFVGFMVVGAGAYALRVFGRDVLLRGVRYRVTALDYGPTTTELLLEPAGRRRLKHRAGQFAMIKIQYPGLSEPHPFTIASAPGADHVRFLIRDLGDWTRLIRRRDIVGADVIIEGPYGVFRPRPTKHKPIVWIAGGVGITPFLSSIPDDRFDPPHLFYAVRDRDDSAIISELEEAAALGRIQLHLFVSSEGNRMSEDHLREVFGPRGLHRTHVALCGPDPLVRDMAAAARSLGARRVEHEEFDMRQGFGPDISREIDDLLNRMAQD